MYDRVRSALPRPQNAPVAANAPQRKPAPATPGRAEPVSQLARGGQPFSLANLVDTEPRTAPVIQRIVDTAETDDSDHGDAGDVEEKMIDWADLKPHAKRLPKSVLFNIFYNLALWHYGKAARTAPAPETLVVPYTQWLQAGVFTRARFKELIGLTPGSNDNTGQIIQMAREGHTWSKNGDYTGASNGFDYDEVIYWRDGGGNIDFDTDPASELDSYNGTEDPEVDAGDVAWQDPVDDASEVELNNDLNDATKGVMPSGKSVSLPRASRAQHFAIADMLYPNARGGTWTWHHLSTEYWMVLVDMRVHAKHGHNGGMHLWS
jgi:hypothetical protein